jgi:hypothetical protein
MAWKITADVVPEKAGRPVSISYSTAPEEIAHQRDLTSTDPLVHIQLLRFH